MLGAPFTIDILNLNETHPNTTAAYLTPNKLRLAEVWDKLNTDTSIPIHPVKIGILDDRIDAKHPEFSGITAPSGIIGKVNFGNTPAFALTPPTKTYLQINHGAAVTGIIGANNISAGGGENYVFPQMNGILSGVSRLDYTIELRSPEIPITFLFGAIGRMDDLINEKVQIINWVQEIYPFDAFLNKPFQSIKKRITNNPDILFVFAAGNDGVNAETSTPAKFGNLPNVITIGAVNNNDERAIFSSEKSSNFGNLVSISAPGMDVDTPRLSSYMLFSGTSASAPLVTGVAGLLKAIKPELSASDIKNILIRTADPIFAEQGSEEADRSLGTGCIATSTPQGMTKRGCRLNAFAAVRQILPAQPPTVSVLYDGSQIIPDNERSFDAGGEFALDVSGIATSIDVPIVNTRGGQRWLKLYKGTETIATSSVVAVPTITNTFPAFTLQNVPFSVPVLLQADVGYWWQFCQSMPEDAPYYSCYYGREGSALATSAYTLITYKVYGEATAP
ncbi:MAG: S8/S53 family peptidase [Candidatus Paceibacterota bacterium]